MAARSTTSTRPGVSDQALRKAAEILSDEVSRKCGIEYVFSVTHSDELHKPIEPEEEEEEREHQ
jgi:hypothetical protein